MSCAKYDDQQSCENSAYAAIWCEKPMEKVAPPEEGVRCCCEGCSPGGCVASITRQSALNSTSQCSSLQPPNGYCNNSTMIFQGHGAAAGSSYCSPPEVTKVADGVTSRTYGEIQGGDCCPGATNCTGGVGPYAISTGGDYPSMSKPRCDSTPGCVAFGQMYAYVTRFHFESKDSCEASARSNQSLGDYHCDDGPASPAEYHSVTPIHAKAPYACFTTSKHTPTL